MGKILFVEGTRDLSNGDLRRGFHKLLKQVLEGRMPRLVMGDSASRTIDKFRNNRTGHEALLLIDLDNHPEQRSAVLSSLELQPHSSRSFFMVQEMEAWFLSQGQALDQFYGKDFSSKVVSKLPRAISKPSQKLMQITRNSDKGKYHKVRHGSLLLELLDAQKLRRDFPESDRLVRAIEA